MSVMLRLLLALTLCFLSGASNTIANTNPELSFERLDVDIWPEYDRPDVLVMYTIYLSDETSLPAELSLRIPLAAGQFSVLGVMVEGTLRDIAPQDYRTEIEDNWLKVDFIARMPVIRLEYYDPGLNRVGDQRDFTYVWHGDYSVKTMKIQVQQPASAKQMNISLKRGEHETDMGTGLPGLNGLRYFGAIIGDVKLGQLVEVKLSYLKPDDSLSVNLHSVQPSQPITLQTSGRITLVQLLPWVLFALIGFLLLGSILWYWRDRRFLEKGSYYRFKKMQKRKVEEASATFCYQCGRRADNEDLFCRTCGTKLRSE